MPSVDVAEAKRQFDQLLEQASRGEDIVITKNDRPLAQLTAPPSEKKRKRTFGSARGKIRMSDDFDEPLDDFREYR